MAYTSFSVKIGSAERFELLRTIYNATSDQINIKMMNATSGREIIQASDIRAASSKAYSGMTANCFLPYNFPVPYVLPSSTELVLEAADKSGSSNNLRFAIHGNRLYEGEAPYEKRTKRELINFEISSGTLAAYGTITKTLALDASAGLLISKLTGVATGAGTVFIQQGKEPWSSRDVHFNNMVGNSQYGHHLTSRKWLPEKTLLSIRFTDLSGSTNAMSITFHGEKVYV
jgi:hypothetical protein